MKRVAPSLLVMLLLIGSLAACGGSSSPSGSQAEDGSTADAASTATSAPNAVGEGSTDPSAGTESGVIKIVSSSPMSGSGPSSNDNRTTIEERLAEDNFQACGGKFKLVYEAWNDSDPATGSWGSKEEHANAQKAAADPDVMVYIGPLNSGAAKVSIPILNRAGVAMISPSTTWPGLTKPDSGEIGEPNVYYPSGKRNFARVVPADDIQGVVAVEWIQELGAKNIFILHDTETYGKGLGDIVRGQAREKGMTILGFEGFDKQASSYTELVEKVIATNPDLIYIGAVATNNFAELLTALHEKGYTGKLMAPDGVYSSAVLEAGPAAENLYITFGGTPPDKLEGAGRTWFKQWMQQHGREPDPYAPYSYESVSVAVAAINKVCVKDRDAIREAIMSTKDFEGIFGTWSFDKNGDISVTTMSGIKIKNGQFEFVKLLNAGPY